MSVKHCIACILHSSVARTFSSLRTIACRIALHGCKPLLWKLATISRGNGLEVNAGDMTQVQRNFTLK